MTIIDEGIRSFDLEGITHDVDPAAHTVAVDYPFEQLDSYRSDFGKGWCDEYLAKHRPVMVVNHNPRDLIGRAVGYQNLGDRAQVVGKFSNFDSVPLAKAYFSHIQDDEIPGWSFHYRNGQGIPHPNGMRGAVRYTKADMPEFGPTPFPAIPGAGAVGLRSEEQPLSIPTLTEIMQLGKDGLINEEGVRALVTEHYPNLREHITIGSANTKERVIERLCQIANTDLANGVRAMTITIGGDGSVSTDGGGAIDDTAVTLATSIDDCLDEGMRAIDGIDVGTLPEGVQSALSLLSAAGTASDELLVSLGIEDVDSGVRAAAAIDDLPDSDFAYIEDGGTKDGSGKTIPRSKRHFPIQDAAHVRNALARASGGQSEFADKAMPAIKAAAKKFDIDMSDSGKRSDEDETSQSEKAAAALARLGHAAA